MQFGKNKKKKTHIENKKNSYKESLEKVASLDYRWVVPLTIKIKQKSFVISKFFSYVFAEIAVSPLSGTKTTIGRFSLIKGITKALFPQSDSLLTQIEKSIKALQENIGEISSEI